MDRRKRLGLARAAFKVLVADPHKPTRRLLEINFQRAGYPVVTTNDLHAVLPLLKSARPALVVLAIPADALKTEYQPIQEAIFSDPARPRTAILLILDRNLTRDEMMIAFTFPSHVTLIAPYSPLEVLFFARRFLTDRFDHPSD